MSGMFKSMKNAKYEELQNNICDLQIQMKQVNYQMIEMFDKMAENINTNIKTQMQSYLQKQQHTQQPTNTAALFDIITPLPNNTNIDNNNDFNLIDINNNYNNHRKSDANQHLGYFIFIFFFFVCLLFEVF